MANINIDLDYRVVNPNFHWALHIWNDPKYRYGFFYGGSSSAKSYSIAQSIILLTLQDKCNTLILRKVKASIKKSIFSDLERIIKSFKLESFFTILYLTIKCKNGARIDFEGVDNVENLKGISGYKRIYVDEISELDSTDFRQLRKRMRGTENQTLLASFNPVSELHFLKTDYYDKLNLKQSTNTIDNNPLTEVTEVVEDGNYIFIKSTYLNNYWVVGSPDKEYGYIDQHTIDDFEKDKQLDFNFYNVYCLGNFGRVAVGGEYFNKFDRNIHVKKLKLDKTRPLHISFDENVYPHMSMTITQMFDNEIHIIDEIAGRSPHNNIISLLKLFVSKYKEFKNNQIFIYGDATSKKQDARTEQGYNLYGMIYNELTNSGFNNIVNRVEKSNPSVKISGDFINRVLSNMTSKILYINESCHILIEDFMYLKSDPDGNILKERVKNKELGITFEKYGHMSDCVRYQIVTYLKEEYNSFISRDSHYDSIEISLNDDIFSF